MKPKTEGKKKSGLDKKDVALIAAKATLSAVPGGGAVAQILSGFKPSYAKQLIKDVEEIDKRLMRLEGKVDNFSVESLKDDDSFKAEVTHWLQVAIRTHDEEKREALRNAVVNSAIKNPPEEDLRSIFLKWADDLEPWHLRILKFLDDPKAWARRNGIACLHQIGFNVSDVLNFAFPDLKERADFFAEELIHRSLITNEPKQYILVDSDIALRPWTTPIGKQFLTFITSPINGSGNSLHNAEEASKS